MAKKSSKNGAPPVAPLPPPAVYFLSLELENIRCFGPRQTLDLSDGHGRPSPWTIILGYNGTGKTTLLQLVALCETIRVYGKPGEEAYALPLFLAPGASEKDIHSLRRSLELDASCEMNFATTEKNGITDSHMKRERWSWCCQRSGSFLVDSSTRVLTVLPLAYGASRRLGNSSLSEVEPQSSTVSVFTDQLELRNAEEWLLRLDYAASKPSTTQTQQLVRLDQVKHLLLSILPEVDDLRFATSSGPNPIPRVEFKTPYGWVPLRQLGYGYQTLIAWVTDLVSRMLERYPDSLNPLAEPAVVLVDEIDLHLHPLWQRQLMSYLTERFPNTQFIATAHSPLVAQAAASANLVVLRREGDHVIIDNDVDSIRGWRVDQILTSDLFGLPTARPPEYDRILKRREELVGKPRLTAAEKQELKELDVQVSELPTGQTAQQVKEMDAIKKALQVLQDQIPSTP